VILFIDQHLCDLIYKRSFKVEERVRENDTLKSCIILFSFL
jgi:hypothetical protein